MAKFWLSPSGKIIVSAAGKPIVCYDCPCQPVCCERETVIFTTTSDCVDLDGLEIELTYDGIFEWTGSTVSNGMTVGVSMTCIGGTWGANLSCDGIGAWAQVNQSQITGSCHPLNMTFGSAVGNSCSGCGGGGPSEFTLSATATCKNYIHSCASWTCETPYTIFGTLVDPDGNLPACLVDGDVFPMDYYTATPTLRPSWASDQSLILCHSDCLNASGFLVGFECLSPSGMRLYLEASSGPCAFGTASGPTITPGDITADWTDCSLPLDVTFDNVYYWYDLLGPSFGPFSIRVAE